MNVVIFTILDMHKQLSKKKWQCHSYDYMLGGQFSPDLFHSILLLLFVPGQQMKHNNFLRGLNTDSVVSIVLCEFTQCLFDS